MNSLPLEPGTGCRLATQRSRPMLASESALYRYRPGHGQGFCSAIIAAAAIEGPELAIKQVMEEGRQPTGRDAGSVWQFWTRRAERGARPGLSSEASNVDHPERLPRPSEVWLAMPNLPTAGPKLTRF